MQIVANTEAPAKNPTPWRSAKRLLLILFFFGLASLNVLTLVSDQVHSAGYGAMKAILATAVSEAAASRILSKSPMAKRQKDVSVAIQKLSQEKNVLVASSQALQARQAMLVKSLQEVEASHSALKRTSEIRAAAVLKTSKRVAVRSLVNTTRNVSSVFAEAIPIVGTGVMLAVTVWDVHDACETLKDINELNSVFDHPPENQTKVCGMNVPTRKQVLDQTRTNAKAVYQSAADALKREGVEIPP
ncbi:MAG: hypothetical protein ACWA6Y_09105 [Polaromonas sp.]